MRGWSGILIGFAAVTALVGAEGGPATGFRHLYLVPTVWAALRFGALGGAGGGLLAAVLYAPFVLPAIEPTGLTRTTAEGLVSLGLFLLVGGVSGALVQRARTEATRSGLLLAVQRALTEGAPLPTLAGGIVEEVRRAFAARAAALVLAPAGAEALVVSRGAPASEGAAPDSAAGWVLRTGRALYVSDFGSDRRFGAAGLPAGRPRRAQLVPLGARGGPMGVLVVEREGEFPEELRALLETLGLPLALGIDNALLTARQRRFTEELAEKVRAATERLTELDRAKSELVSVVSHELRTPLTSIQGFSELLLSRRVPAERGRRVLAAIHREAERLGRIVADLLDLARIESGRAPAVHPVALPLAPLVEANCELFGAQSARHAIVWEVPADLPAVRADHDALDRILKNLLSNALRYSPRGGTVRVWARPAPDGERVELGVSDEGLGIPAAALPRIFDKYSRIAQPEAGAVGGLGLGLALVKALVEAQGGSIQVESEVGAGSRFLVNLPVARLTEKADSA